MLVKPGGLLHALLDHFNFGFLPTPCSIFGFRLDVDLERRDPNTSLSLRCSHLSG